MAGIAPSFVTAPRLRIKVADAVLAYAVGMDIRFPVQITPVTVVGEFRPVALEPVMIGPVSGTMQIVRLLSSETNQLKLTAPNETVNGNQEGINPQVAPGDTAGIAPSNSVLNQGNLFRHLDPSRILLSSTFDIEVYIWRQVNQDGETPGSVNDLNQGKLVAELLMKVIDCRLTGRTTNIAMGQIVNEPVNFQGLLAMPGTPSNEFALDTAIGDQAQNALNGQ